MREQTAEASIRGFEAHDAHMLRELGTGLLDLLYPPVCAACSLPLKQGRSLCTACDESLPRLKAPFCQCCGEAFEGQVDAAATCPRCLEQQPAYDFARPVLMRSKETLELIHHFKYLRQIHLAGEFGRIASEAFADKRLLDALIGKWPLVPVPLHRSRQRKRHFNQAAEIARAIGATDRVRGLPVVPLLKRVRSTGSQTKLTREQRRKNLSGAFELTKRGRRWLEDNHTMGVVLIDDVLTTGATVEACAKVLHRAGVDQVVVVTVMRG